LSTGFWKKFKFWVDGGGRGQGTGSKEEGCILTLLFALLYIRLYNCPTIVYIKAGGRKCNL